MALVDDAIRIAGLAADGQTACELALLSSPGPRRTRQGVRYRVNDAAGGVLARQYLDGLAVAVPDEPPTGQPRMRRLDLTQHEFLDNVIQFVDRLPQPAAQAPRNFLRAFKFEHGIPKAGVLTYAHQGTIVRAIVGIAGVTLKPTRMMFGENGLELTDQDQLALGPSIAVLGSGEAIGDDDAVERLLAAIFPATDLAQRAITRLATLSTVLARHRLRWVGADPTNDHAFWTRLRQRRLDAAATRERWQHLEQARIAAYVRDHGGQTRDVGGELHIELGWDAFLQVIDDLPSRSEIGQELFLDPSTERMQPGP